MSGRERIPFLEFKGFQGLFTKANQEVIQAEQLRICQNVDFFDEYGAISGILVVFYSSFLLTAIQVMKHVYKDHPLE